MNTTPIGTGILPIAQSSRGVRCLLVEAAVQDARPREIRATMCAEDPSTLCNKKRFGTAFSPAVDAVEPVGKQPIILTGMGLTFVDDSACIVFTNTVYCDGIVTANDIAYLRDVDKGQFG